MRPALNVYPAVENLTMFINHGVSSSDSVTSSVSQNIGLFKGATAENNTAGVRWTKYLNLADRRNYKLKKLIF